MPNAAVARGVLALGGFAGRVARLHLVARFARGPLGGNFALVARFARGPLGGESARRAGSSGERLFGAARSCLPAVGDFRSAPSMRPSAPWTLLSPKPFARCPPAAKHARPGRYEICPPPATARHPSPSLKKKNPLLLVDSGGGGITGNLLTVAECGTAAWHLRTWRRRPRAA